MSPLAATSKVHTQHQPPWDAVLVPFGENSSSPLCSPSSGHPFIIKSRPVREAVTVVRGPEQAPRSPCLFVPL